MVNVANDERVRILKGSLRPIVPEAKRVETIESLRFVDYTICHPEVKEDVAILIARELQPDILATHSTKRKASLAAASPRTNLVIVPNTEKISTSDLVRYSAFVGR